MKKTILICLLFTLLPSCEKADLCESENCTEYFNIWKSLFISRNNLTQEYFDKHIKPTYSEIDSWMEGQSFRVEYKVKIDWAEANLADQFIIWIDPSTEGLYPSLHLPRSTYLTKAQINSALDIFACSSSIYEVAGIDHLKYSSRREAISVLEQASGVDNLDDGEIWYQNPSFNECLGHPFLWITDEINRSENKCISCKLDLFSGETEVRETSCWVSFIPVNPNL
jgi:hypothetical protein